MFSFIETKDSNMKLIVLTYFVAVLSCVWAQTDSQPKDRESLYDWADLCPNEIIISDQHDDRCYLKFCYTEGTNRCRNKPQERKCRVLPCIEGQIGYKEGNLTKPYPRCCGEPICREPFLTPRPSG